MLKRNEFRKLRDDISEALEPIAEKYGITIEPGNVSYTDIDATMKLSLKAAGDVDYELEKFNQLCQSYGFEPEHYRMDVFLSGQRFKLVGFNPKAQKYPLLIEADNGKRYKAPVEPTLGYLTGVAS